MKRENTVAAETPPSAMNNKFLDVIFLASSFCSAKTKGMTMSSEMQLATFLPMVSVSERPIKLGTAMKTTDINHNRYE